MPDQEFLNEERKQRVAKVFDNGASTYDRVGSRFFSYFGQRLVEVVQPEAGSKVLDVATGRGAVLFPLAKRLEKNGSVVGIDISAGMIKKTAAEIVRLGLTNAEVCLMDVENLHFPDGSFNYVLCGFGLAFFPNLGRALAECRRVLSPGGRFATTILGNDNLGFPWMWELFSVHIPPQILQTAIVQMSKLHLMDPWLKEPELKSVIHEAGFKDVEVISEQAEFVLNHVKEWWGMLDSLPPVRALLDILEKLMEPEIMERLKADATERLQDHRQSDGYHHSIPSIIVQGTVN